MKIKELINYEEKSKIKAGNAISNGKYPFFTSSEAEDKRYDQYTCDAEGIIMGTGGNATLHYYNGRFAVSTDCLVLKTNQNVKCKYLYYFFKANMNVLQDGFKGAGLKHTNKNYIENIELNKLPNIKEQNIIIERLDRINNIIQNHKKVMNYLDTLIKARFVEMFGDSDNTKFEINKLGNVAKVGSSHRVFTEEFVEDGIPFYRGTEIGKLANGEILENVYYISKEHYEKISSDDTKPKIGDLLLPSICDKGQIWLVDTKTSFYYKDGRVLSISPNKNLFNSKYLQYYLKMKTIEEYHKLGSGSTFAEFKIFILQNIDVLIPPIDLQNIFATFVKEVDKLKFDVQKSLEKTQMLFDSLMQQYFK